MFHHFWLLRGIYCYKLRESTQDVSIERFRFLYNRVPEITYECQVQGHVRSTMAIIQNQEEEARGTSSMDHVRRILR